MTPQTMAALEQAEYFYDMLDQLLEVGRAAGGDALIDATLISGLLATRRAQVSTDGLDTRRSA